MFLRMRLKDVHLRVFKPLTLNRCNHALYFENNMVMFYHFQMFILYFYCSFYLDVPIKLID